MTDILVIGGGVVGTACALELAQRGASVRVLERDTVGHGCSFGNAGWLTPSLAIPLSAPGQWKQAAKWMLDPESPFAVQLRPDPSLFRWLWNFQAASRQDRYQRGAAALVELSRWSVDWWEALAKTSSIPFGFARAGRLALYETPKSLDTGLKFAGFMDTLGEPHEVWTTSQVREAEPAVRGPLSGGLFFPQDAHCEPFPAVQALAAEARSHGVEFLENTEVVGAAIRNGTVESLRTPQGSLSADQFVLAAGLGSGSLGRTFGIKLPMLGAKGYSIVVPRLESHPTRSLYLADRKLAVNPHAHGLRISGTLELVDDDLSVNQRRVNAILRGAREMLALPEPLGEPEVWSGVRPCLSTGMPLIDRAPELANLWLATGHQMTGLKTAPGTARLLANLMSGEPPGFDAPAFALRVH